MYIHKWTQSFLATSWILWLSDQISSVLKSPTKPTKVTSVWIQALKIEKYDVHDGSTIELLLEYFFSRPKVAGFWLNLSIANIWMSWWIDAQAWSDASNKTCRLSRSFSAAITQSDEHFNVLTMSFAKFPKFLSRIESN